MAFFGIRFDLRDPGGSGATRAERYAAALDMAEWADAAGFAIVTLSEHHGSPDGYLPSPLAFAAAVAARTERIALYVAAVIAPLHDPLRLAEDAAVVDLLSGGRLHLVLANGYVPDELAMFGVAPGERAARTEEAVRVLQQAFTGEPFEHRGRVVRVTPTPSRPGRPVLLLGGSSDAAAGRAARLGVGYQPSTGASWPAYREACVAAGGEDPGPYVGGDRTVTILAEDPEAAWEALGPHLLHDATAYGSWAEQGRVDSGYQPVSDLRAVRASGQYRILTPDGLLEDLAAAGPLGFALFHPLVGGTPPELGWESLRLLEREVLPRL
ncbi:MAG: LLM class flavin-dependent oxidoreductase [Acidimicrobiia bacterium]